MSLCFLRLPDVTTIGSFHNEESVTHEVKVMAFPLSPVLQLISRNFPGHFDTVSYKFPYLTFKNKVYRLILIRFRCIADFTIVLHHQKLFG